MPESEEYNGWSNFETWNANLWLTNDQGMYERSQEIVKGKYEYKFQADDALKEFYEECVEAGIITDRITAHRINWTEIVEAMKQE